MKCGGKLIHCHDNRRSDPPHLDSSRRGCDSQPVSEIVVQMQSTYFYQQGDLPEADVAKDGPGITWEPIQNLAF